MPGSKKKRRGLFSFGARDPRPGDVDLSSWPPPGLWNHNAAMIELVAAASKMPPIEVLNRFVELACNDVYADAVRNLFQSPMLVASKVIRMAEASTGDAATSPGEGDKAAAVQETSFDAETRLHLNRILAGLEAPICPKCKSDAELVEEKGGAVKFLCRQCGTSATLGDVASAT